MTLRSIFTAIVTIAVALSPAVASETRGEDHPSTLYQLRTYRTAPEKLEVLVERFARVNLPLFDRHGITLVGAWTPHESDDSGDRLVYLVAFDDRESADRSWEAFASDPEWVEAFAEEKNAHGEVVTDVQAIFLEPTDYSPTPHPLTSQPPSEVEPDEDKDLRGQQGGGPRLFELRRYVASPGKLDDLNARFRNHTMELFAKHGMTNVVYTTPTDPEDQAESVLLYFVSHAGHPEAINAWESFRSDPAWTTVREESQPDGVPLAAEVESWMLVPTEFSPLK